MSWIWDGIKDAAAIYEVQFMSAQFCSAAASVECPYHIQYVQHVQIGRYDYEWHVLEEPAISWLFGGG